jgi:hypothetical protein
MRLTRRESLVETQKKAYEILDPPSFVHAAVFHLSSFSSPVLLVVDAS